MRHVRQLFLVLLPIELRMHLPRRDFSSPQGCKQTFDLPWARTFAENLPPNSFGVQGYRASMCSQKPCNSNKDSSSWFQSKRRPFHWASKGRKRRSIRFPRVIEVMKIQCPELIFLQISHCQMLTIIRKAELTPSPKGLFISAPHPFSISSQQRSKEVF